MRPSFLASTRSQRRSQVSWAALSVLCGAMSGCLGGQTGTEAAPNPAAGGSKSENQTGGTVATDNGTASPTASTACNPDPNAVGSFEVQTGMTTSAVVEFVRATNPSKLQYGDESITDASLQLTPHTVNCVIPANSGASSLNVPVIMALTSDDARVNLVFTGAAVAYAAAEGGVGEVELTGSLQCDRTSGLDAMSVCAIVGVDQSAYARVSIDLSVRVQLIAGVTQVLGTLRVSGSVAGSCSPQPCSIADWVSVTTLSLSSAM